jgi:hypothetical protein
VPVLFGPAGEINLKYSTVRGHAVALFIEALRYKLEGCGFDFSLN